MTKFKSKDACPQCGSRHGFVVGPTDLRPILYCHYCKHIAERLGNATVPIEEIGNYPNGTVVQYRKRIFWLSRGLEGRIVTDVRGHWFFIKELRWKTFKVLFVPPKGLIPGKIEGME